MSKLRKDLCPTSLFKQDLPRAHCIGLHPRQFINISSEGDSILSLGNLLHCAVTCTAKKLWRINKLWGERNCISNPPSRRNTLQSFYNELWLHEPVRDLILTSLNTAVSPSTVFHRMEQIFYKKPRKSCTEQKNQWHSQHTKSIILMCYMHYICQC